MLKAIIETRKVKQRKYAVIILWYNLLIGNTEESVHLTNQFWVTTKYFCFP